MGILKWNINNVYIDDFQKLCYCRLLEFLQIDGIYIHIYWEKNDFNANIHNLCFEVDFIYWDGEIALTFSDTKYRDRAKKREKAFEGLIECSDKSLVILWHEHFFPQYHELALMDTILWQTIWFTMICGFISSFKCALLSFDIIYLSQ